MDLIYRQAAIDAVLELDASHRVSWKDAVIDVMDSLPSAQPEIIQCGECKHYVELHNLCKGMDQYVCHMKHDDFCSKAERRE